MKKIFQFILLIFCFGLFSPNVCANEPDSTYLFAYTTDKNKNRAGLFFAWSNDQKHWHPIGPEYSFLRSDYAGGEGGKQMFDPFLFQSADGCWHIVWTLNNDVRSFSYSNSTDLINWKPQSYPIFDYKNNFKELELTFDVNSNSYSLTWLGDKKGIKGIYRTTTKDFKTYSPITEIQEEARANQRTHVLISGKEETGTIHKVSWSLVQALQDRVQLSAIKNQQNWETMRQDPTRFANLKPVDVEITVTGENKTISNNLIGIFFEDLNYAADGGIYAELIQNRGFEYSSKDRKEWNSKSFWQLKGENVSFEIVTDNPIHKNNPHYALLKIEQTGASLLNEGFGGIVLKANDKYDLSLFARTLEGKSNKLKIRLIDEDGTLCGEVITPVLQKDWEKHSLTITAKRSATKARLEIIPQTTGTIAMDMVSLFPQKTFKGRKNGLRADLAQTLADMKPHFVRFPGGCLIHGNGLDNMYQWKNSIGPLEARKCQSNIWGYHQTTGLGYFEYFQFCSDIGAEPVPIVPAAVSCQNSAIDHKSHLGGQQGGIPLCEMDAYIQDIFDLIEWANGDPKKSKWAKMRADAGHPKSFNLKYIGVGNEDLISDVFEERFALIYKALKEKHPEITVIGTTGPFSQGSDYKRGWEFATELGVSIVDEHYYQAPGWFIHNQEYYDRYDRSKPKVYLGEYAAHISGRHNNIETALLEALHLTNIERNGDIVLMSTYAPLLAKEGFTQWNPDLIYFNNTEVKPSVGYFVQKLFGVHSGDEYWYSSIKLSNNDQAVAKRIGKSIVRDKKTGDIIIKLVNLLPVEAKTKLDLKALKATPMEIAKTTLTGTPDNKTAKPTEVKISWDDVQNLTLPPYSFTVLRVQVNYRMK